MLFVAVAVDDDDGAPLAVEEEEEDEDETPESVFLVELASELRNPEALPPDD